jgi:hypothetical protein
MLHLLFIISLAIAVYASLPIEMNKDDYLEASIVSVSYIRCLLNLTRRSVSCCTSKQPKFIMIDIEFNANFL